jgi:MraZ protein
MERSLASLLPGTSEVFQVFRGSQIARVDEKGRLKIPADFKRLLDERNLQTFFITSYDGERAEIFPLPEWERIEAEMASRPASAETARFFDMTSYFGQEVQMDSAGRLLLPQHLRETAGLTGDLAVLGQGMKISAINNELHQARLKAAPLTIADIGALGIKGL